MPAVRPRGRSCIPLAYFNSAARCNENLRFQWLAVSFLAIWLVESEEISEGVVAATALLALEDQQLASIVDTP